MTATLARATLFIMMIFVISVSMWRHGKQVRSFRFDARWPVLMVINEAVLILFAGGWG